LRIDVPVAALISTDPTNGPHTAGVPFKFDASPKIGAFSSTIIHHFTTLNSLTSRDGATFQTNRICSVEAQAVCSARGDANSHGNDEWENDHEVRIVKSQDTSPPVELHRKLPVAGLLLLSTCPPVPFAYSVGVSFSFALLTPTRRTIGEFTVSVQTETLGGRLPLLEPSALSAAQKEIY
jgi:hypothetical protein